MVAYNLGNERLTWTNGNNILIKHGNNPLTSASRVLLLAFLQIGQLFRKNLDHDSIITRIAKIRNVSVDRLEQLVDQHTEKHVMGPDIVNVLILNLALDELR